MSRGYDYRADIVSTITYELQMRMGMNMKLGEVELLEEL